MDERLHLWRSHDGVLSIHFTPFDWVNCSALLMLVGITPGAQQADEALGTVRRCHAKGMSTEECLREADRKGPSSAAAPLRILRTVRGWLWPRLSTRLSASTSVA